MADTVAVISNSAATAWMFRRQLFELLLSRGYRVVLFVPEADEASRRHLTALGVELGDFALSRSASRLGGDLRAMLGLVGQLRRLRPQVVLSTFLKPVVFGSLAARLAGVPRIASMIEGMGYAFTLGPDGSTRKTRWLRRGITLLLRMALRANKVIFVLNRDDEAWIGAQSGGGRLVFIDGIGVDLEAFPASPAPVSGQLRFLFVGRLLREKGIHEYVEAARLLRQSRPDLAARARWNILGGMDDNPGALGRSELEALQSSGLVHWLGMTDAVLPVLEDCSVFVLPSWREGKPRSTMEAMAVGRAVITTDVPGCRETVLDGDNGLLVPAHDPLALARAMEYCIEHPAEVVRMGERSAALARQRFDVRVINQAILEALGLGV